MCKFLLFIISNILTIKRKSIKNFLNFKQICFDSASDCLGKKLEKGIERLVKDYDMLFLLI